jgi:hypothetical protein
VTGTDNPNIASFNRDIGDHEISGAFGGDADLLARPTPDDTRAEIIGAVLSQREGSLPEAWNDARLC